MQLNDHHKAFTLTELLIVVFIIGVMAAFAVPSYTRSIERSHKNDAETQLTTIWSAEQIYRAQNGSFWPASGTGDITAINTNLSLGIIPNGMIYSCSGDGTNFNCTAARQPPAALFTIAVNQAQIDSTNPSCTGNCP